VERLDLQAIQEAQAQRDQLDKLSLKDMWDKLDQMVPPDLIN
jgi:hypothetical protein